MFFKNSQRNLTLSLDKEAWDNVRDMLKTPKGQQNVKYNTYIDPISGNEITFLHLACRKRAPLDVIKSICALKPSLIQTPSETGADLPLHYAAASGLFATIDLLLHYFPLGVATRCDRKGAFGNTATPLHVAISNNASADVILRLIRDAPTGTMSLRDANGKTAHALALPAYQGTRDDDRAIVLHILQPKTRTTTLSVSMICGIASAAIGWRVLSTYSRTTMVNTLEQFSSMTYTVLSVASVVMWCLGYLTMTRVPGTETASEGKFVSQELSSYSIGDRRAQRRYSDSSSSTSRTSSLSYSSQAAS